MQPQSKSTIISDILLNFPWTKILSDSWEFLRKAILGLAQEGMYEVLEYESTLELLDVDGKRARFQKRKKVRYLQNNIIAYQDHAWGDGDILLGYKCSPGVAVDQYRAGYKTYILISLREVKSRGDWDEFNIEWKIRNGFLKEDGFWSTDITHRTQHVRINLIFPHKRPPKRAVIVESNRHKTQQLGQKEIKELSDGRVKISWEEKKPALYEHYLIRWWW